MPRAIPNPEPLSTRTARPRTPTGNDNSSTRVGGNGRAAAFLMEPVSGPGAALLSPAAGEVLQGDASENDLRRENARLREIIAELQQTKGGETGGGQDWQRQQKEYEGLLEEKSELIRNLHLKIRELEDQPPPKPPTPDEEELLAMSEQLERDRHQLQQERKQLDDDLRQFKEDEETMTRQMREMEVQMARERAELARQRTDVQRMLDDLRRELERYERDQGLSDRLGMIRQRYQEVSNQRGSAGRPPAPEPTTPNAAPLPTPTRSSGILGRLFGQGK